DGPETMLRHPKGPTRGTRPMRPQLRDSKVETSHPPVNRLHGKTPSKREYSREHYMNKTIMERGFCGTIQCKGGGRQARRGGLGPPVAQFDTISPWRPSAPDAPV